MSQSVSCDVEKASEYMNRVCGSGDGRAGCYVVVVGG